MFFSNLFLFFLHHQGYELLLYFGLFSFAAAVVVVVPLRFQCMCALYKTHTHTHILKVII